MLMRTNTLATSIIAACGLSLTLGAAPALAQDLTIADLAPAKTSVLVGVDDFERANDAFQRSGTDRLWNDPELRQWFEDQMAEFTDDLDDFMRTIDADIEDIAPPTGMAGLAVWLIDGMEDEDAPQMFLRSLMAADFGENADSVHDVIVKALENGEDEDALRWEEDDFAGGTIWTIEPLETDEDDAGDGMDDEWGDWDEFDQPADESLDYEAYYYARVGSALMVSTDLKAIENAMARLDGDGFDSLAGNASFTRLMPRGDNHHAYVVFNTDPMYQLADTVQTREDEAAAGFQAAPPLMTILDATGASEVRGGSLGITFDADNGAVSFDSLVNVPALRGMMSLINAEPAPFAPPAFVGPDVASVAMYQFKFDELLPTLQRVVNNLPAQFAQQLGPQLQMGSNMIGPIFGSMGSKVYVVSSYTRPYSATSTEFLFAIEATDTQTLTNQLSAMGPQFGLQGRDFNGNQIFSTQPGMLGPASFSVGIGFGNVFIGPDAAVENALRQAEQAGKTPGLVDEEGFKDSMRALGDSGLSFTWTSLSETIDYLEWQQDNIDAIIDQQVQAMFGDFDDEEFKNQMRESMREQFKPLETFPAFDTIRDIYGDMVGDMRVTDEGLRGRFYLLRADEE